MKEINLPNPLTAQIKGTFAYLTVKDRMPVILTNIIDYLCREKHNISLEYGKESLEDIKDIVGKLSGLKSRMQTDKEINSIEHSTNLVNDDKFWLEYINSYKEKNDSYPSWFSSPWIFVECFMYRRIHEIFVNSKYLHNFDPFMHLKKQTLVDYEAFIEFLVEFTSSKLEENSDLVGIKDIIETFIQISLWGNQCDLSLTTSENLRESSSILNIIESKKGNILSWEFESFWLYLTKIQNKESKLGLILDNAGVELMSDLCLLTLLIKFGFVSQVTLYPKIRPYFVSDTTEKDFEYILSYVRSLKINTKKLCNTWQSFIDSKQWIVRYEAFWTAPQCFPTIKNYDPNLYKNLEEQSLLIFKGDLNFRKLTSDLDWPRDTPFKTSLCDFHPAPILSLRTIKGGPVTGLDMESENVVEALKKTNWNSGDFGLVQFVP